MSAPVRSRRALLSVLLALPLSAGTAPAAHGALPTPPASAQPQGDTPGQTFALRTRASGFNAPIWVGAAPGDSAGLWVAEQGGRLYRVRNGKRVLRLSIATRIASSGEQGLLGVAFLPSYASTKLVVLSSTNRAGDSRIELWKIGATAKRAKLVRTLLRQDQPYANHNGGHVTFGAGNTLYLGFGDGGAGDDPERRAQNPATRLGKILSATVTATNKPSWRIVASGVRNPWRFSYEAALNELWVGDVGQGAIEEVDRVPLGGSGAAPNLGWGPFEGGLRNPAGGDELRGSGTVIWPVVTYEHGEDGCSITGGSIYRGDAISGLRGRYVFGDYCSGRLWSVAPQGSGVGAVRRERATISQLTSFGTDARGELHATSGNGTVYRFVAP